MNPARYLITALLFAAMMNYGPTSALAVPQQINYQGSLTDPSGTPLDTVVAITFNMWPVPAGGTPDWTETHLSVTVSDGLFHVLLGSVTTLPDLFAANRWLGITIGGDTEMTPRQQIVSVAHAYRVGTVDGASGGAISGDVDVNGDLRADTVRIDNAIAFPNGTHQLSAADTSGLASRVWVQSMGYLRGTNNVISATGFVGGGDFNKARGAHAVVTGGGGVSAADSNSAAGNHSVIGGGRNNIASDTATTISGGRSNLASNEYATIGGGRNNRARGLYATVGGGGGAAVTDSNSASGDWSSIGGGRDNTASGLNSTVSGGANNTATGTFSTVSGGSSNDATASWTTISGGFANDATATGATVGGGGQNQATGAHSVVAGGGSDQFPERNIASGDHGAILGGRRNIAAASYSTVGGGDGNKARGDYSVVCGGGGSFSEVDSNSASGDYSFIGGGSRNTSSSDYTTVSGGVANNAQAFAATVSGGEFCNASGDHATVAGGSHNRAIGFRSSIGGGGNNRVRGNYSVIAGGGGTAVTDSNTASGDYSFIGGGTNNTASGDSSVVCGGSDNTASVTAATVGGGYSNVASDFAATIPGGYDCNASGRYSFAAGRRANANDDGAFVWADSTDALFTSPGINTFNVRSSGGINMWTNNAATVGVTLLAGDNTWNSICDSTLKTRIKQIEGREMLDKISELPIYLWHHKDGDPNLQHIGPMAQDFWKAFHVGGDSLKISTIDPAGIALAAIQELAKENLKQDAEIQELKALVQTLMADKQQSAHIEQEGK